MELEGTRQPAPPRTHSSPLNLPGVEGSSSHDYKPPGAVNNQGFYQTKRLNLT